jgi:excinuclease ABC subunit A
MTAMYLNGEMKIEIPEKREGNGKFMKLTGATGNNLKTYPSSCLWVK